LSYQEVKIQYFVHLDVNSNAGMKKKIRIFAQQFGEFFFINLRRHSSANSPVAAQFHIIIARSPWRALALRSNPRKKL
jgi:hypothetical protein